MEVQSEPKPKRKYVMTPERRAKLMANLAQARLAPKEKVYRKTPKRYAANIGNLEKANAKVRQQSESLREGLEGFFPAPEVPPPPPVSPLGPPLPPLPGAPAAVVTPSSGAKVLDDVTPLIAKRLRKVHAATRREGRRIMRLLTAAISRSQPLTADEAFNLAIQLLQCLDGGRLAAEVRRLNEKIAHLLMKLIETRYGAEAQVNGVPVATILEQLQEERRQQAAARAADRPPAGRAGAAEGGKKSSEGSQGQRKEPSHVSVPELPRSLEEFQRLLARALDLEGGSEAEAGVSRRLAESIWERLHCWKRRAETEGQRLERLFQVGAAAPLDSEDDPRLRTYYINMILNLDDDFLRRMSHLTAQVRDDLRWWIGQRPMIRARRESAPRAKPPVGTPSDQPIAGSADPSAA